LGSPPIYIHTLEQGFDKWPLARKKINSRLSIDLNNQIIRWSIGLTRAEVRIGGRSIEPK
jgi:hypothetical protein